MFFIWYLFNLIITTNSISDYSYIECNNTKYMIYLTSGNYMLKNLNTGTSNSLDDLDGFIIGSFCENQNIYVLLSVTDYDDFDAIRLYNVTQSHEEYREYMDIMNTYKYPLIDKSYVFYKNNAFYKKNVLTNEDILLKNFSFQPTNFYLKNNKLCVRYQDGIDYKISLFDLTNNSETTVDLSNTQTILTDYKRVNNDDYVLIIKNNNLIVKKNNIEYLNHSFSFAVSNAKMFFDGDLLYFYIFDSVNKLLKILYSDNNSAFNTIDVGNNVSVIKVFSTNIVYQKENQGQIELHSTPVDFSLLETPEIYSPSGVVQTFDSKIKIKTISRIEFLKSINIQIATENDFQNIVFQTNEFTFDSNSSVQTFPISFLPQNNQPYYVKVTFKDVFNRISSEKISPFIIANLGNLNNFSIQSSINSTKYANNENVLLKFNKTGEVSQIQVSYTEDFLDAILLNYSNSVNFTLENIEDIQTLYARGVIFDGNNFIGSSDILENSIILDKTPPEKPNITNPLKYFTEIIDIFWNSVNDNLSGLKEYYIELFQNDELLLNQKTEKEINHIDFTKNLKNGEYIFKIKSIDNALNESEAKTFEFTVERTIIPPEIISETEKIQTLNYTIEYLQANSFSENKIIYKIYKNETFIAETEELFYQFDNLIENENYKFSVQACDEIIELCSDFSEVNIKVNSIEENPSKPILIYPKSNEVITQFPLNIDWNESSDIDGDKVTYHIEISNKINFETILFEAHYFEESQKNIEFLKDGKYYLKLYSSDETNKLSEEEIIEFEVVTNSKKSSSCSFY